MIALDLCQANYQVLLIIYLKGFITKNVENVSLVLCTCQLTEDNKLIFKCIDCNNNYSLHFNKDLINRFTHTYKFCNKDINKFILLSREGIYPYEYMDGWERFDETFLPNKEYFIVV